MTNAQAMDALATGAGAQYPMLSATIAAVPAGQPRQGRRHRRVRAPGADAADTSITMWQPNGIYIAKSTEGDKLDAAKKFVAFANSADGCQVQNDAGSAAGPYVTSACTLPDDAPALIADIQAYFDSGQDRVCAGVPLPIKGPNLENITVAVGSGITPPEEGAAQYDQDVTQQAQQLGLDGW